MFDLLTTPGKLDIAYSWIDKLFANDPGLPLSAAFAVFTSSLAFLASLLMGWHVLIGIVSTAYSGKVLGEKWHQIWAPLRVVLGFGLLVPVGGGFSSVHYLLRNVIGVAAVNLGNAPIVAYITAATSRENVSKIQTTYGAEVARLFIDKEMCFAVVNALNTKSTGRLVWIKPTVYQPPVSGKPTNWFTSYSTVWDYGDCGQITFYDVSAKDSEMLKDSSELVNTFNGARQKATQQLVQSIQQANFIKYDDIATLLATGGGWNTSTAARADTINSLVNKGLMDADIVAPTKTIGDAWNASVSTAAQEVFATASKQNGSNLLSRIQTYGFMVSGSYERALSAVSGLAVNLASSTAVVHKVDLATPYMDQVNKALNVVDANWSMNSAEALAAGLTAPSSSDDWIPWMLSKLFPNLVDIKFGQASNDPVGDMMTFGHTLLWGASIAIVALITGAGATALASTISQGAMAAFNMAASWVSWMIVTMIVLGFMYSFLLPMLPMIMVFVMGVGWLVLYLEAAIAGVMWAFAFIRMEGSEFFDKNQAPGVTLLFNLILRPALGMLAYCGMLLLQPLLLNSLAVIWDQSFSSQTQGGLVQVWQFFAGLVLYSYLQWHLTIRLTSLIPQIPDKIGHWMGLQMAGGNDGHEVDGAMRVLAGAGMAMGRAPFGQMAGDLASARSKQPKNADVKLDKRDGNGGAGGDNGGPDGGNNGGPGGGNDGPDGGGTPPSGGGTNVGGITGGASEANRGPPSASAMVSGPSGADAPSASPSPVAETKTVAGKDGKDGRDGDRGGVGDRGVGERGDRGTDGRESGNGRSGGVSTGGPPRLDNRE